MQRSPAVIAHRGYTADYPENTIPALRAAVDAGAHGVELDVQFTRDDVPVVFHDSDLTRVTGAEGTVAGTDLDQLQRLSACEPQRFGNEHHRDVRIPTLAEAAESLRDADITVFVEVKRDSLPMHRIPAGMQSVLEACRSLGDRLVIISFDSGFLQEARSLAKVPVGWVLSDYGTREAERAQTLEPEYLFCDQDLLPPFPAQPWPGPWRWAVYEVNDVRTAQTLRKRGIACIETREVPAMLEGLRE